MLYINRDSQEEGQGLVEYGLILILVSVAVVILLSVLGTEIAEVYQEVTNAMDTASSN